MGARKYTLIEKVKFNPGDIVVEIGSERGEGIRMHACEILAQRHAS